VCFVSSFPAHSVDQDLFALLDSQFLQSLHHLPGPLPCWPGVVVFFVSGCCYRTCFCSRYLSRTVPNFLWFFCLPIPVFLFFRPCFFTTALRDFLNFSLRLPSFRCSGLRKTSFFTRLSDFFSALLVTYAVIFGRFGHLVQRVFPLASVLCPANLLYIDILPPSFLSTLLITLFVVDTTSSPIVSPFDVPLEHP